MPTALHEIRERMPRRGADTTRGTELAQLVEMVRARTVDLWLAVGRLRDAAGEQARVTKHMTGRSVAVNRFARGGFHA